MEYSFNHSIFLSLLHAFKKGKIKNFNKFKQTELSHGEKQILRSQASEKKGKHLESLEYLNNLSGLNPFLEGFRYYYMGGAQNNLARYNEAIESLKKSISFFKQAGDEDYIFQPLFTLACVWMNFKKQEELAQCLEHLEKLSLNTRVKEFKLKRIQVFHMLLNEQANKALKLTSAIMDEYADEIEDRMEFYFMLQICALVKLEQYQECYHVLQKCQRTKGFRQGANYKYIKSILDFLTLKKSIYAYPKDFEGAMNLYHELMVIKSLESGDTNALHDSWQILAKMNEDLYQKDLHYNGDITLFSKALDQFAKEENYNGSLALEGKSFKTHYDKLKYIFLNHDFKIPKDDLIMALWQEEWSEKSDQRLRALIYRLKKNDGLVIKSKEGNYYLKEVLKKAA